MTSSTRWFGMFLFAVLGTAVAANAAGPPGGVTPPRNQCPGDCSPCVGQTDPFCDPSSFPPTPATPENCLKCGFDSQGKLTCLPVAEGETGSDTCGLLTNGMTVVRCTAQGSFCAFTTVHS